MKTIATVLSIIVLIIIAIQLVPFFVASIGVSEYSAHNWYCNSTGGHMSHIQWEGYIKGVTSEQCQYN